MENESPIQDNQRTITIEQAIEDLNDELIDLREQVDSFIKDYKTFTSVTNETMQNLMQFLFQYQSLVESQYANLIKNDIISKQDLDSVQEDIYKDMISNLQISDEHGDDDGDLTVN